MSLDKKELLQLMKIAATAEKASPVAYSFGEEKFTYSQVNEAIHTELAELAGDFRAYRRNKDLIFDLIEQTIDEVLPPRVMDQYGAFADVQTVGQGDKPVFRIRITEASRRRAKSFITKVGLAGIYEVFKLDGTSVTIDTMAYGGAAQIGLEEFLDGRITMSDVLDIVMEALDEAVYTEIAAALLATISSLPNPNTVVHGDFDETHMDRLLAIADTYGRSTIYCTFEFAATMVPASGWVSDELMNERWANGYLGNYKGHQVVILPQSFTDNTNATKVINPQYAWIIPTGANKPVKIIFEGQTIAREYENKDGSTDVHVYKKIGVGTLVQNNICSYQNTGLSVTTATSDS